MTSFTSWSSSPTACFAAPVHHFLIHVLYHLKTDFSKGLISELYLSDLEEVVGYQSFPFECFVTKGWVGENEEGDFDELGQLLLHNDVNHPSGNSFIE